MSLFLTCKILRSQIAEAIKEEKTAAKKSKIFNVDRSVCGRVAGAIAKQHGEGFAGRLDLT